MVEHKISDELYWKVEDSATLTRFSEDLDRVLEYLSSRDLCKGSIDSLETARKEMIGVANSIYSEVVE